MTVKQIEQRIVRRKNDEQNLLTGRSLKTEWIHSCFHSAENLCVLLIFNPPFQLHIPITHFLYFLRENHALNI